MPNPSSRTNPAARAASEKHEVAEEGSRLGMTMGAVSPGAGSANVAVSLDHGTQRGT